MNEQLKSFGIMYILVIVGFVGVIHLMCEEAKAESWRIESVDSLCNAYDTSIAIDSNGRPHISYRNALTVDDSYLKYAYWTGTNWEIEIVDSDGTTGLYTSIAIDDNDRAHISYYDKSNYDLRFAHWTGAGWSKETVDEEGSVGMASSIALDDNMMPHISYSYISDDWTKGALKYANWTGTEWNIEIVDGWEISALSTSIAIDSNNRPHIVYFDSTNDELKYAYKNESGWQNETIDSNLDLGRFQLSMALNSVDRPHVSYFDSTFDDLKYAYLVGTTWDIEIVDQEGSVGKYSSLALDSNDRAHISYRDSDNDDLKYAYWTGMDWSFEIVDSEGDVGSETSIAIDSNDTPHICYRNEDNNNLKYATLVDTKAPYKPTKPSGPTSGIPDMLYTYSTSTTDPDGDQIKYTFDWGDGRTSETDYVNSGTVVSLSHSWLRTGTYYIKGKATDINKVSSEWSELLTVTIKKDTPPEINLISPLNNSLLTEASILNFNISDENLNLVTYSINQDTFQIFTPPYDLDTTDWEDDIYVITIRAEDNSGHLIESWFNFRIDLDPPSIVSTSPNDDTIEVNVAIEIVIEFSESMNTESVSSAILISPPREYSVSWGNGNKTMTINLSEQLAYDTYYQVSINTQAKDLANHNLKSKYEFEFTTQEKPKEDEEGFQIIYLLLALLLLIIVVIAIVVLVLAKKKKVSRTSIPSPITLSQIQKFTCPKCDNTLQINDIGTTMNVTCPFCSTLLTVKSRKAPVQKPEPQQPTTQISCPQCSYVFQVINAGGPMRVQCPNCRVSGTINLGPSTSTAAQAQLSQKHL